ncbi:unnamed protein product [Urochloa decumbens]|uniref:F-box domain-containing protein n=1 Tax=Urochloa decumbens TaxID=240449 RepID=A0ABC9GEP0_9POAL
MMASPPAHSIAGAPAAQLDLPDEIMEEIFVRLDASEDLARASAACTTFYRIVSARRFLRRYRSLHAPPLLGVIAADLGKFYPAEPPHRSAPAGRAVARATDFTFSFLPKPNFWRTRDGRVILSASASSASLEGLVLVVCDPLHRRYVEIPPIPGDLVACVRHLDSLEMEFEPFLAPPNEEENESSSFRVICNVMSAKEVVTFIFSSATKQWRHVTGIILTHGGVDATASPRLFVRHYAHNCFYWMHPYNKNLLALDMGEMKFSFIGLPPKIIRLGPPLHVLKYAIVELGESRLGFLTLGHSYYGLGLELYLRDSGADAQEWRHSKTIPMPNYNGCHIVAATEGYVLILQAVSSLYFTGPQYFTLELKTMQIERMCSMYSRSLHHKLYANFPPPLSPPSI